jgi:hypothetical protein
MNALRILLLVLAVGVLGLVGWRATIAPTAPSAPAAPVTPPPNVVALTEAMRQPSAPPPLSSLPVVSPAPAPTAPADPITAIPEFSSFYGRLKQDFPHDFDGVFDNSHPDRSADSVIWDALRSLEQQQGILAAQAGDKALDRFFDARSAMLEGLAPLNARQCVDFLYGVTDASIVDFTAAHHGLVATLADRTLDAIADGRLHHIDRATPTPGDLDALSAALAAHGLSPDEIGLLIDGTTPDPPLSDDRTCAIGRTYLDVLHDMPSDARERIYGLAAELLARS